MGEVEHSPRRGFFYFNDDAELVAMRFENWKIVFAEQRCQGTLRIWAEPFTPLRVPKLFNLRTDPFEYADITSNTYYEWFLRRDFFVFYATAMAAQFLDTFKEFPPRHPPASFSVDQIVKKLEDFLAPTKVRLPLRHDNSRRGLRMPDSKPNILVIWGDDIGISNLSCYSRGMMGYFTPNIDRIADEGMLFTDSYGEQSCTAGRSSFITGQSVYRTGMSKVGMPGVDIGLQKEDPTIAELLKPMGYATGQFGKNHLGDLNKFLPTAHGFDEFFGNLYHLNAEEEPENADYPTEEEAPLLRKALLPRGVIHSWATDEDSGEVDDRYGPVGKQRIEDTGPLTKMRMETIDDETTGACIDFIRRQHEADTPFFVWMNMTHMHFRTHTKPESLGQAGRWQSPYHDTMIDHDRNVGHAARSGRRTRHRRGHHRHLQHRQRPARQQLARRRDHPVPQREGHQLGGRLPDSRDDPLARKDQGRASVSNEIVQHHDWLPTFLAAAGDPDIVEKLKNGPQGRAT